MTDRIATKQKGDLIEDLVSRLVRKTGLDVRSRVHMPTKSNPRRYREVDVLVTSQVLGRTMHLAFECKNYGNRIGVSKVDEFRGKLEAVGIPVQHGIMVTSANGYTADAVERAKELGIALLLLDGLTDDRLEAIVYDAWQTLVYVLLSVTKITLMNDQPRIDSEELLLLRGSSGEFKGTVLDLVWAAWRDGRISLTLGSEKLPLQIPSDWHWIIGESVTPTTAEVEVKKSAYVVSLPGKATQIALVDATSGELDRSELNVDFAEPNSETFPVVNVDSEQQLSEMLQAKGRVHISMSRVPLPRIAYEYFWPPSERFVYRLDQYYKSLIKRRRFDLLLEKPPFRAVEGRDLKVVWEPIWTKHPASRREDWPWTRRGMSQLKGRVTKNPRHLHHPRKRRHASSSRADHRGPWLRDG